MSYSHLGQRLAPLAMLLLSAVVQAQDPTISEVTVVNDTSLQITIRGVALTTGSDAVVSLGDIGTLSVDSQTTAEVTASAVSAVPDGDYLLTVTNALGTVTYDLTLGAVGPPGPPGPPGGLGSGSGNNTAGGTGALLNNTTGIYNTAIGSSALMSNTTGQLNTATGALALRQNTTGKYNTASGVVALYSNTTGNYNTASGSQALKFNTTGNSNTASGVNALYSNTTGDNNIALGHSAGFNLTGSDNIAIGNQGVAAESETTRIGTTQTRAFISGIRGITTGNADAVSVVIDSAGQLGTVSSSRRYKEDIDDMGTASNRLMQLRPVTFHYKEAYENGENPLEFGLIAEEVAEVMPELVVFNKENQPETVKYRILSSLLLNELQKQNRTIKNQEVVVAELKAQVAELADMNERLARLEFEEAKRRAAVTESNVIQSAMLDTN